MIELKITGEIGDVRADLVAVATAFGVTPPVPAPEPTTMDDTVAQFKAFMAEQGFDVVIRPLNPEPEKTVEKPARGRVKPETREPEPEPEEPTEEELAAYEEPGAEAEEPEPKMTPAELEKFKTASIKKLQDVYAKPGGAVKIKKLIKTYGDGETSFSKMPAAIFPAIMQDLLG